MLQLNVLVVGEGVEFDVGCEFVDFWVEWVFLKFYVVVQVWSLVDGFFEFDDEVFDVFFVQWQGCQFVVMIVEMIGFDYSCFVCIVEYEVLWIVGVVLGEGQQVMCVVYVVVCLFCVLLVEVELVFVVVYEEV